MHCLSCDSLLRSSSEISRKYRESGKYIDLCDKCFDTIKTVVRVAEQKSTDYSEFDDEDEM